MAENGGGRGWFAVLGLAVLTAAFSVVSPAPLIFLPLAVLVLALPPWRPLAVALAATVAILFFASEPAGSLWYVERGWALILSAWFVAAVLVWPSARFLPRALVALCATVATAAVVLVIRPGAFARVDELISGRLHRAAEHALETWGSSSWMRRVAGDFAGDFAGTLEIAAQFQTLLFPALLTLASLAGLAVAWWAYGRLATRDVSPLGSLREFRFHDGLVWLLIGGLLLLLLPLDTLAMRAGSNLLAFMAALYTLRGLAVLLVIGGTPGPLMTVIGAVLIVLLYPLVLATTFVVGLTDTWLDIRTRRAAASSSGSD
ncbi:MAG: hypothetical protein ACREM1_07505 [Longimicrobiales bacterium]